MIPFRILLSCVLMPVIVLVGCACEWVLGRKERTK